MKQPQAHDAATRIIEQIEKSLANSSWKEKYPKAYAELFTYYKTDMIRDGKVILMLEEEPSTAKFKVDDRVEWTNLLNNTFTGSIVRVDPAAHYVVKFDDGTAGHIVESELTAVRR